MNRDNIIESNKMNKIFDSFNISLKIFEEIILIITNFLSKLIYYIILPFSFNLIRYPFDYIQYPLKFRSLYNQSIYSFFINITEFSDNDIIIISNPDSLHPNLTNAIICQNHISPIRDILTTMYINNKLFSTPLAYIGTIFSSFENYYLKQVCNKILNSMSKELSSMIMLEWDETNNKPVTGQIPKLIHEVNELLDNKWNVAIYPQGRPDCNQNTKFRPFKSGLSHLIKHTPVDVIILISSIYLDENDNLLDENEVNKLSRSKIRVMVEQVKIDRNQIDSDPSYIDLINVSLQDQLHKNLDSLKIKFVKAIN